MKCNAHSNSISTGWLALLSCSILFGSSAVTIGADDGKLRIICFGAHPDDCELRAAGGRGEVVEARTSCEICVGDKRRHWTLANGRRTSCATTSC